MGRYQLATPYLAEHVQMWDVGSRLENHLAISPRLKITLLENHLAQEGTFGHPKQVRRREMQ